MSGSTIDTSTSAGRTAICLTGQPRLLNSHVGQDTFFDGRTASHAAQLLVLKNLEWAGPRHAETTDNVAVDAMINNVFAPLSMHGGFDLFVVAPGAAENGSSYEALRPTTVNSAGKANRMFVKLSGPESSIPYNKSDERWKLHFYSVRHPSHAISRIQSLLYQLHDMRECNQMIAEYASRRNVDYAFKMRLRTDLLFLRPIPPPSHLDLGTAARPKIRVIDPSVMPANVDKFGVGAAKVMDCWLDGFSMVHTYAPLARTLDWTAEWFLEQRCKYHGNVSIQADSRIQAVVARAAGYDRNSREGGGGVSKSSEQVLERGRRSGCGCGWAARPNSCSPRLNDGTRCWLACCSDQWNKTTLEERPLHPISRRYSEPRRTWSSAAGATVAVASAAASAVASAAAESLSAPPPPAAPVVANAASDCRCTWATAGRCSHGRDDHTRCWSYCCRVRTSTSPANACGTQDEHPLCVRQPGGGGCVPPLLWSFPGSGNTWVRLLVDSASGLQSGSLYRDAELSKVLPGEMASTASHDQCARVSVIKAHWWEDRLAKATCDGRVRSSIFLVRHPFDAIWSDYQRVAGSGLHNKAMSDVDGPHFAAFALARARQYVRFFRMLGDSEVPSARSCPPVGERWDEKFYAPGSQSYANFANQPGHAAMWVRYEDLTSRDLRQAELARMLRFAGLPIVDAQRLELAFNGSDLHATHRGSNGGARLRAKDIFNSVPGLAAQAWSLMGGFASQLGYSVGDGAPIFNAMPAARHLDLRGCWNLRVQARDVKAERQGCHLLQSNFLALNSSAHHGSASRAKSTTPTSAANASPQAAVAPGWLLKVDTSSVSERVVARQHGGHVILTLSSWK